MPAHSRLPWLLAAIKAHNSDKCLIWPFGNTTERYGYGYIYFEGRVVSVHRLAFKLKHDRWPSTNTFHSCGHTKCFNYMHVVEGGCATASAKLTWFLEALASHKSDACLLWPFDKGNVGYGRIHFEGKRVTTHRLAFMITHGRWPLPEGCHSCDNKICFNPLHIFEGSHDDNMKDASVKGLMHPGEQHGMSRLTDAIVLEIRAKYVAYSPIHGAIALGKRFGVRPETIGKIIRRKSWKHI